MKDVKRPILLTEDEVSEWFKIPRGTLRRMRSKPGRDPLPFMKIGGAVRYDQDSIVKWLERNTFDDASDAKQR